jgi:ankyrin repeat protein
MFEASARARAGDVPYFGGLAPGELEFLVNGKDEDGRTLLHTAAANGHLELLELLARAGAGKVVNKPDDEVRGPVAASCAQRLRHNRVGTYRQQLPICVAGSWHACACAAPRGGRLCSGRRAQASAPAPQSHTTTRFHLPPSLMQGWTPLHSASSAGHERVVAALLSLAADPDLATSNGTTALHYAVRGA